MVLHDRRRSNAVSAESTACAGGATSIARQRQDDAVRHDHHNHAEEECGGDQVERRVVVRERSILQARADDERSTVTIRSTSRPAAQPRPRSGSGGIHDLGGRHNVDRVPAAMRSNASTRSTTSGA